MVEVELVDASRTGVGFDSRVPFAHGDRLVLDLDIAGDEPYPTEVEIVRYDAQLTTPYGARFVDRDHAGPFFARILEAVWTEPVAPGDEMIGAPATAAEPSVVRARHAHAPHLRLSRLPRPWCARSANGPCRKCEISARKCARIPVEVPGTETGMVRTGRRTRRSRSAPGGERGAARVVRRRRADLREHREQQVAHPGEVGGEHLQDRVVRDRRARRRPARRRRSR